MLRNLIKTRPEIHTRDIRLSTHAHAGQGILVHGVLKDQRCMKIIDVTGTLLEPGVIHHMEAVLFIQDNPLRIVDAEADMIHIPIPQCRTTLDTVEKLKGLEIKPGFSKNIRTLMGGKKGCTHLAQLILAMGQEIVQGWLCHKRDADSIKVKDLDPKDAQTYLMDSCRMWTKTGPKTIQLKTAIKQNRPD